MQKQEILEAFNFRHACKIFDANREISKEDFDYLLDIFRYSPSSFGMEPWRIIVVKDKELRQQIQPLCWNQAQITTCSELVIFTVDIQAVKPHSEYVKNMFARRGLSQEMQDAYNAKYADYHSKLAESGLINMQNINQNTDISARETYHWCAKQCYIAAANMMSMAAMIGIDSCPIEGFEKESLEKLLGLDTAKRQVALIVPFGYRIKEQPPKHRLDISTTVEYR